MPRSKTGPAKSKRTPTKPRPAKAKEVILPDGDPSAQWTIAQLRQWATFTDVDLGDLRLKADILATVLADLEPQVLEVESLFDATNRSIAKAIADRVLDDELHAGPIATLRILARKIDTEDEMREVAIAWNKFKAKGDAPAKPPPLDNVSIATYRNYCESLGLTVAGAKAAPAKGGAAGGEPKKSKLGHLRSVHGAGA